MVGNQPKREPFHSTINGIISNNGTRISKTKGPGYITSGDTQAVISKTVSGEWLCNHSLETSRDIFDFNTYHF